MQSDKSKIRKQVGWQEKSNEKNREQRKDRNRKIKR